MKNFLLLLSLLAILLPACNTARKAKGSSLKPKGEKVLMKQLLDNQVSAEWLSAKAKVSYSDEYGNETFSANIRLRKDSVIWMNFKKFSIEGARALITPDSIFVIDRLNNEYLAKPFDFVQQEFKLPLGFAGLQAMLLGNPVFFGSESEAGADSIGYTLSQKTERFAATYWLDGAKMLLRQLAIEDVQQRRTLKVKTSDYRSLDDGQDFSYFRSLKLKSADTGDLNVEIEFTKVEINVPQSMEFKIPDGYKRLD